MHQFNHMKIRMGHWFLLLLFLPQVIKAQSSYTIPAYTAYAVPAEEMNDDGESKMFSNENGVQNWTNTDQKLQFFFKIRSKGMLQLSLLLKNDMPGNKLLAEIANHV